MHIPSDRVYNKMRAEAASIWYVPANNGEDIAVLIKAPTPTLKAIISGCSIKLLFGKKDSYLCAGVQVEDVPDIPLLLSGAQIVSEEHEALFELLLRKETPIFLFNEMDICVVSSTISISEKEASLLCEFLGEQTSLYVGEFNSDVSFAVDCFVVSIDKTQVYSFTENDHITHRVLHVQLVSKIARTIGRALRLNEDLIEAIGLGHDLGHAPFGHMGERCLNIISQKNGLRFVFT